MDSNEKNPQRSDNDSVHNREVNQNNVNLPNTIKYPKGGAVAAQNSKPSVPNEPQQEPKQKKRISGRILVFMITVLIAFEYYIYVFILNPLKKPQQEGFGLRLLLLALYHLLLFMMVWSLVVTMSTHPGEIPLYWGFYIGDEEYKRKRYCLICNAFKPERSHHCSVCNVCVLNMDHHCPWVNNCIGFFNRKFFMQLLFYLFMVLWYTALTCVTDVYKILSHVYRAGLKINEELILRYAGVVIAYSIILVLCVLNSMFFKYHVKLVLSNSTTIESLDPENKENAKVKTLI